jgi:ankyrin repeat protein
MTYAAGCADPELLRILIQAGGHLSHRDRDGDTPLAQAMLSGRSANIPLLMAAGAQPEDAFRGDWDALAQAVKNGQAREGFADLAARDQASLARSSGAVWTQGALTAAVLKGDVAFIQTAEAAGVDLSVP